MIGNADLLVKAQTQDAPPSRRAEISADASDAEGDARQFVSADQDASLDGAKASPKVDFAAVLLAEEAAAAPPPLAKRLAVAIERDAPPPPPGELSSKADEAAKPAIAVAAAAPAFAPAPPAPPAPSEAAGLSISTENADAAEPARIEGAPSSLKAVAKTVEPTSAPLTTGRAVSPSGAEETDAASPAKVAVDAPNALSSETSDPLSSSRPVADAAPRAAPERQAAPLSLADPRPSISPQSPSQPAADANRVAVAIEPAAQPTKADAKQAQTAETAAPARIAVSTPTIAASSQAAPAALQTVVRASGAKGTGADALPPPEKASFEASLFALKGEGSGGVASREATLSPAAPTAPIRPAPAATQISAQLAAAVAGGDGDRVEVQLDPPELGRLTITYAIGDDRLAAVLSAERGDTGELLRRHADMLARELERLGFGEVSLSFADKGGDGEASEGRLAGLLDDAAGTARDEPVEVGLRAPVGADGRLDIRL